MRRLALLSFLLTLAAGPAAAHAQLVAAEPAEGAVLPSAPQTVVLTFDEPVTPLVFRWLGPDGAVRELAARSEGRRVLVPVPPVGRGSQLLSWRVVSSDGHPVGGACSFAIGASSATAVTEGPVAPTAAVAAATQGLLTLLLVFGVGGAVFASVVDPAARAPGWTRSLARAAASAAVPAAALALLAHGCDLLGSFHPPAAPLLRDALASPFARTVALAALAGLLVAAGRGRATAVAAWAAAALSFAASGHTVIAPPVWLTTTAMALHGAALLFWLGALLPIVGWAASGRPGLVPALGGFSRLALPLVGLLLLSGAVLATIQLGRPAALIDTAYGRLLAVKLIAVAAMLTLAAVNRTRLTPHLAAGGSTAGFRRSVTAEIVLGLAVLTLASGFRLTPPPRILAVAAAARPVTVHLHGATLMAMLTLDPGRPGPNSVEISLMGPAPLAPAGVSLSLGLPAQGIEPLRLPATGDGEAWRAGPFVLPVATAWVATLRVRTDDFTEETLTGEVPLGP